MAVQLRQGENLQYVCGLSVEADGRGKGNLRQGESVLGGLLPGQEIKRETAFFDERRAYESSSLYDSN